MTHHLVSSKGAGWLGVAHFLVDAVCVACVLRVSPASDAVVSTALAFILGYDLLAFAGQLPLGALVDRLGLRRGAALAGIALTALALVVGPGAGISTIALAGLGNALFHVGAGAMVMAGSKGRATPTGVFVAPGALGLGLGLSLGRGLLAVPMWPWLFALAGSVAVVLLACGAAQSERPAPARLAPTASVIGLALLFLSVAVRSLVGTVACDACPHGVFLVVAAPLAGCAGKLTGGFFADRFGWVEVSVAALLAAAPLLAWSGADLAAAISGLALLQMTMPVTLAAVFRILPTRPATGFGFLCVALVGGALPAYLPGGWRPHGSLLFLLVTLSAVALFAALRPLATLSPFSRPLSPPFSRPLSPQPTRGNP